MSLKRKRQNLITTDGDRIKYETSFNTALRVEEQFDIDLKKLINTIPIDKLDMLKNDFASYKAHLVHKVKYIAFKLIPELSTLQEVMDKMKHTEEVMLELFIEAFQEHFSDLKGNLDGNKFTRYIETTIDNRKFMVD